MRNNQLSRYGAVSKALKNLGPMGKVFFVADNSSTVFSNFQNEFPNDFDGTPRVYSTIQAAINAAVGNRGDVILVAPKAMAAGATDPVDYAEALTIAPAQAGITIAGIPSNRTQGGLPQIKKGSGTAALLTIQAPGCHILNLGFNGLGSTGGGILLDDDGSTKSAFGTTIEGCHFKNCVGSTATSAATGGAIQWNTTGGAWQVRITGNKFYKNVGDIVLLGTSAAVPQDVVIEYNVFSGPAASVDCQLYLAGGSGMNGVYINKNVFPAFPALSLGATLTFIKATGCVGTLTGNMFGSTGKTFGAAGNVVIPTTLLMAGNYQEVAAGANATGEVGRT